MKIDLSEVGNGYLNRDEIISIFGQEKSTRILVPLKYIGSTQSYLDIVSSYADAIYVAEKIALMGEVLSGKLEGDRNSRDFVIDLVPTKIDSLADLLWETSGLFGNEDETIEEATEFLYGEIAELEENFHKRKFSFPELADGYWANLINGAYYEMASEYYEDEKEFFWKTFKRFPEHRYGFWKSASSTKEQVLYFSSENWILPGATNLSYALKLYSGIEKDILLEPAEVTSFKGRYVAVSDSAAIWFDVADDIIKSLACVSQVLLPKVKNLNLDQESSLQGEQQMGLFLDYSPKRRRIRRSTEHFDPLDKHTYS